MGARFGLGMAISLIAAPFPAAAAVFTGLTSEGGFRLYGEQPPVLYVETGVPVTIILSTYVRGGYTDCYNGRCTNQLVDKILNYQQVFTNKVSYQFPDLSEYNYDRGNGEVSQADGSMFVDFIFAEVETTYRISTVGFASVPEPSSWALMILGFGVAGLAARRRRTAAVS